LELHCSFSNMAQVEAGKAKAAGVVGIILLCFGLAIVICGFVWISYGGGDGTGLWSGIGILVAGILGIVTWVKLNKIAMIFFLILCILEIILLAVQCVLALLVWLVWQLVIGWVESDCETVNNRCVCGGGHSLPMEVDNCDWVYAVEATFIAVVILSAFGAIVSFAGSIIGCMGVCCANSEQASNTTVIVQQPVAMVPQNAVVVTTQGQTYPQQSTAPPAYSQQDQSYQTKPVAPPGTVAEEQNAYPMADH